jgi:hypothetical protein
MRRVKTAVARSRRGEHLRVGGRLEPGPDGLRRLELEVVHESGEPATVIPLEIVLDEDGRPVMEYHVERRPGAAPLTVVFVFPRPAGSGVPSWCRGALDALLWKRPTDVWWAVPYVTASERGGSRVSSNEAGVEMTADRAEAETLFDATLERVYFHGVWGALERALDPTVAVPGKRRIIVYGGEEAGGPPAGADLTAAAEKCGASVSAVCHVPDAALEDLCRRTQGNFRIAGTAAEIPALVEGAHRAALEQYVVTYRGAATGAPAVRVRIHQPDGWGEILLASPDRSP